MSNNLSFSNSPVFSKCETNKIRLSPVGITVSCPAKIHPQIARLQFAHGNTQPKIAKELF